MHRLLSKFRKDQKKNGLQSSQPMQNEMSCQKYQPAADIDDYYLIDIPGSSAYVFYDGPDDKKYILKVKENGHAPKSGLLLSNQIQDMVLGKDVLEVGCGETGIVSIHSSVYGAKSVTGCDVVPKAVEWAKYNAKINRLTNISFIYSDVGSNLPAGKKYDLIVSNPPQMPMCEGSVHDTAGPTGRELIYQLIDLANDRLVSGGKLILLAFDFLGIDESYGEEMSLMDILKEKGFESEILSMHDRTITRGGQTEKSLDHIKEVYPGFEFSVDLDGQYCHKIVLFSATKL